MRDLEEISEIAPHVSHFTFRRRSSGLSSLLQRFFMAYCILAQLSILVSMSETLQILATYLIPSKISLLLTELWIKNPKIFSFSLMFLCLLLYRCYPLPAHEESLLVIRSLGVQTTSGGTSRFIPKNEVRFAKLCDGIKLTDLLDSRHCDTRRIQGLLGTLLSCDTIEKAGTRSD